MMASFKRLFFEKIDPQKIEDLKWLLNDKFADYQDFKNHKIKTYKKYYKNGMDLQAINRTKLEKKWKAFVKRYDDIFIFIDKNPDKLTDDVLFDKAKELAFGLIADLDKTLDKGTK